MAFCFKIYGASYLHNLLQPMLKPLLEDGCMSLEVDPARLDAKDDLDDNRTNLVTLTQRVFGAIVSSADKFPTQLRSMCHCLYQVLSKRYPQFPQNNIGAVGTVIFLRFINPAIGNPCAPLHFHLSWGIIIRLAGSDKDSHEIIQNSCRILYECFAFSQDSQ